MVGVLTQLSPVDHSPTSLDTDLEDHCHMSAMLSSQRPLIEKLMSPHSLAPQFVFYNVVSALGAHSVHHRPILKLVTCTCAVQPSKEPRITTDSDSKKGLNNSIYVYSCMHKV